MTAHKNKRARLRQHVGSSKSLFNIAAQNQHLPAMRQALDASQKPFSNWEGGLGSVSSYLTPLLTTRKQGRYQKPEHRKVRNSTGGALWMTFVNLAHSKTTDENEQQAINLILGPVADALALKISEGKIQSAAADNESHISGLASQDIAFLTNTAEVISRGAGATWIAEENLPPIKRLRKAAVNCWIDMHKPESNM